MPKTIPCWDCKGKGRITESDSRGLRGFKCPTCKGGGVLSVYTQEEVKKLVGILETISFVAHEGNISRIADKALKEFKNVNRD